MHGLLTGAGSIGLFLPPLPFCRLSCRALWLRFRCKKNVSRCNCPALDDSGYQRFGTLPRSGAYAKGKIFDSSEAICRAMARHGSIPWPVCAGGQHCVTSRHAGGSSGGHCALTLSSVATGSREIDDLSRFSRVMAECGLLIESGAFLLILACRWDSPLSSDAKFLRALELTHERSLPFLSCCC